MSAIQHHASAEPSPAPPADSWRAEPKRRAPSRIWVKLLVSPIRCPNAKRMKAALEGLGLRRPGQIAWVEASPPTYGALRQVSHLVRVMDPDETEREARKADARWREELHRGGRPRQYVHEPTPAPERLDAPDRAPPVPPVETAWMLQDVEALRKSAVIRGDGEPQPPIEASPGHELVEFFNGMGHDDSMVRRDALLRSARMRRDKAPVPNGESMRRELPRRWYSHLFDQHSDVARNAALVLASASKVGRESAYSQADDVDSLSPDVQVELRHDLEQLLVSVGDRLYTYVELEGFQPDPDGGAHVDLLGRLSRSLPFQLGGEAPTLPMPPWVDGEISVVIASETPGFDFVEVLKPSVAAKTSGDIAVAMARFHLSSMAINQNIVVTLEVPGRLREIHEFCLPKDLRPST